MQGLSSMHIIWFNDGPGAMWQLWSTHVLLLGLGGIVGYLQLRWRNIHDSGLLDQSGRFHNDAIIVVSSTSQILKALLLLR